MSAGQGERFASGSSVRSRFSAGRWLAAFATIVTGAMSVGSAYAETGRPHPQPAVTTAHRTQREAGLVVWARDRFRAAGLAVPTSAVIFRDGLQACGGFDGRYYPNADEVVICVADSASTIVLRTLVLHELSHAWTEHNLTDAARERFVELRGA